MKKKGRRIGETTLPEAIIQHIPSFMNGKEAARTTILSKSWYNAWLTRPALDFDKWDFKYPASEHKFCEFATKTMQRYENLNLKIDSFRLRGGYGSNRLVEELIAKAMKIGLQTLVRLSLTDCEIDGNCVISCSDLKALTLNNVEFARADLFKDIILCCILMEELSLSYFPDCRNAIKLRSTNLYQLHKLRRLFLAKVDVDNMFFTEFASRFPCLKDLSILLCRGCTRIHIATTSLETISFEPFQGSCKAKFDVPNIHKFTFSCSALPSKLSIQGASRAWEFDISIACNKFRESRWFLKLKQCLTGLRLARITLSLRLRCGLPDERLQHNVYSEVVGKPLAVENLMIDAPSSFLFCSPDSFVWGFSSQLHNSLLAY